MKPDTSKSSYSFENPYIGGKGLIIPNSLKWLARRLLSSMASNSKHHSVDFEKAASLLESFLTRKTVNPDTGQQPTHSLCQGLRSLPFWEPKDAPLIKDLSQTLSTNHSCIQQEYLNALESQDEPLTQTINTGEQLLDKGAWQNYKIGALGQYSPEAKQLFPETVALLSPFNERIFSAEFIAMEPDTCLPPHTDATNAYLVAHLGLQVPENCGLQVKNQIQEFHQGDVVFFDQSFIHSAWNKGETTRTNLLITFFHPDINDQETSLIINYIDRLKKRALIFSPIILTEYFFLKMASLFRS